jgi:hypothetical protein
MSETPHNNDEAPWWDRALTPEKIEEEIRRQTGHMTLEQIEEEIRQQHAAASPSLEQIEEEIRQRNSGQETDTTSDTTSEPTHLDRPSEPDPDS